MTVYANKLHALVLNWFPEFVHQYGPNFIIFLEEWVKWMEQDGNVADVHNNQLAWRDINQTKDEFVDVFHREFMKSIPTDVLCDRRVLLKRIKDFFLSKGSQKAYQLLFRILYNEEIEFYYPGRDLFRSSAANYVIEKRINVTPGNDLTIFSTIVGQFVTGATSGARALVEAVESEYVAGVLTYRLRVSRVRGTFEAAEWLKFGSSNVGLITAYYEADGYWIGTEGFASSNKRLQGAPFWHEYSYVIKSSQPVVRYAQAADLLCHPVGTIRFGEVSTVTITDALTPQVVVELAENYSALYDFEILVDVHFPVVVDTELIIPVTGTGTMATANTQTPQLLSGYTASNLSGLSPYQIYQGGYIMEGSGTVFSSEISNGDVLLVNTTHLTTVLNVLSNTVLVLYSGYPVVPSSGLPFTIYGTL